MALLNWEAPLLVLSNEMVWSLAAYINGELITLSRESEPNGRHSASELPRSAGLRSSEIGANENLDTFLREV